LICALLGVDFGEASMHTIALLPAASVIGGASISSGALAIGRTVLASEVIAGAMIAHWMLTDGSEGEHEASMRANTNPFSGPVDEPVTAVDSFGNAIRVEPGQYLGGKRPSQTFSMI
jgi:hypothetical protein